MSANAISEGVFVRVGLLTLLVEEVDGLYFVGSDEDGEEYQFTLDKIDAIL